MAGSLPFLPPAIAPSQSLVILVPENFLLQLCGSTRIVTHSPPKLFWSWAPHSVLLFLLPHSALLVLYVPWAQPLGKPRVSVPSYSGLTASGDLCQGLVLLALVDGESMTGVQSNRTCSDLSLGTTGWAQGSSNSIIQAPSVLSSPPLELDSLMAFRLIFFLAPFFKP